MSYHYGEMLKEHRGGGEGGERKRRRRMRGGGGSGNEGRDFGGDVSGENGGGIEEEEDDDDFEDVELSNDVSNVNDNDVNSKENDAIYYNDESEDSNDFEDVNDNIINFNDIINSTNTSTNTSTNPQNDSFTINLQPPEPPKPKTNFISKQERSNRILIHQMYLGFMLVHGITRNKWCNNKHLQSQLKFSVSPSLIKVFDTLSAKKGMSTHSSVRFTDNLRLLMNSYGTRFRVSKQGLVRKNWNQLSIRQHNIDHNVTQAKFNNLVTNFQGSRDVGAQGFVALMRSLGLKARLVFSIQPPDFTLVTQLPKIEVEEKGPEKPKSGSISRFKNNKHWLLAQARNSGSSSSGSASNGYRFTASEYPIFWVEVWNRFNQKWLCIDPIVLKIIEQPPMRRKSSFEPPGNDETNRLYYAIAFDGSGKVKDVTRRYSQQFNGKTVKKRLLSRSPELNSWYQRLIEGCSSTNGTNSSTQTTTKIDILELKEFRDRDLAEGMPNNVAGFKDHPLYALESQLRQNEVIYPMDDTTKIGTFRYNYSAKRKKNHDLLPVYKRSAVHRLRSAKAWYLRGRVLKLGVQPLKIKPKKETDIDNDNNEDEPGARLYAETQTSLYIPPPIIDGKIIKNAYGNIDVYVATMVPEGGVLLGEAEAPMKLLEQAAKIVEIDFARAIVAFDFGSGGGGRSSRGGGGRTPNARVGGIVIAEEYKEAVTLVLQQLIEEEQKEHRNNIKMNSFKNWKYFLTKLRISERLNKKHGRVDSEESEEVEVEESESEEYSTKEFSDGDGDGDVNDSDSDSDGGEGGGFLPQPEFNESEEVEPAGFIPGGFEGDEEDVSESIEREYVEKDSVEKDSVEKDSVEKDSVEKYSVEKDSVEKDSVEKDSVEKDSAPVSIEPEPMIPDSVSPQSNEKFIEFNETQFPSHTHLQPKLGDEFNVPEPIDAISISNDPISNQIDPEKTPFPSPHSPQPISVHSHSDLDRSPSDFSPNDIPDDDFSLQNGVLVYNPQPSFPNRLMDANHVQPLNLSNDNGEVNDEADDKVNDESNDEVDDEADDEFDFVYSD